MGMQERELGYSAMQVLITDEVNWMLDGMLDGMIKYVLQG